MNEQIKRLEVPVECLRWEVDGGILDFESTSEVDPITGTIAQDRALEALRMGIENNAPGFNVFVSGITGTGRSSTVASLLRQISPQCRPAPDRAYVHNFDEPDRPRLLSLPRGQAVQFAAEMKLMTRQLLENLPKIFESPQFESGKKEIVQRHSNAERKRLEGLEGELKEQGLALASITIGEVTRPEIVLRRGDKALPIAALRSLVEAKEMDEAEAKRLFEAHASSQDRLQAILKETRESMREMASELDVLIKQLGGVLIDGQLDDLRERFADQGIRSHLDQIRTWVLDNLEALASGPPGGPELAGMQMQLVSPSEDAFPTELAVNVVLDNSQVQDCPIIMEPRPTFKNLFGVIERVPDRYGAWHTDFTKIHAGSFLRADGGALVLNAQDVLREPLVWETLKNVLRFRQLEIQNPSQILSLGAEAMSPQPIPVDVKVVLIGDYHVYQMLSAYDPEFDRTFKVLAHFDSEMEATPENIKLMARLVARICTSESLLHVDRAGFAALLENSVRRSGRRDRLPTRFGDLADVLREADYYARRDGKASIDEGGIEMAVDAQRRRHSLVETKLQEAITSDSIKIATSGRVVGQINGLAVYDMRAYMFGKPSRVTVATGVGSSGIINIEREAGMSGQTHNKGMLILAGYLRSTFAQDMPLTLSASIAFEQSYGMIDGDSASSTELYALLSSLAGLPIDQGFAVTGSVNQRGEVQVIGGVNEKVEAFFELCEQRGLSGTQGVLIPAQNVRDLQLDMKIADAVSAGKFRVLAIEHVDQGIEILTGVPVEAVHAKVRARLEHFRAALTATHHETSSGNGGHDAPAPPDSPPPPPPPKEPCPPPPPPRDPGEPT